MPDNMFVLPWHLIGHGKLKWIVRADKDLDPQGKWSMEMPWAERETLASVQDA